MGQMHGLARKKPVQLTPFPDIASRLPPELAIHIMSNLNATELCMAAGVNDCWQGLASDNCLWRNLCLNTWGCVSAYEDNWQGNVPSYKELYLILDEGTVVFNVDPERGISYMINMGIIEDTPESIAAFVHSTRTLKRPKLQELLGNRQDVLEAMVQLDDYTNQFLPNALRQLLSSLPSPCITHSLGHFSSTSRRPVNGATLASCWRNSPNSFAFVIQTVLFVRRQCTYFATHSSCSVLT
eukprot:m.45293 g.45293  ORF g.45293 m.45293 type:complete len:240 (+) comp33582_c0_seq6:99-818(+)